MWKRELDGRAFTFRLAGINNQNFLMRDEETGSYWQQISGRAISGPMRGRQLELIHADELTFGLWRKENPQGTVLKPKKEFASEYESKDWEGHIAKAPTVVSTNGTSYKPRDLMLGIEFRGAARAYPVDVVLKSKLIQDRIGGVPIIIVVGPDQKSFRAFEAKIKSSEAAPGFYRDPNAVLMDSITGSRWNFRGCAIEGPATGQCLHPIPALKDYWFDWRIYHPQTTVFNSQTK